MRSLRTREKYLKEKSSRADNSDLQGLFLLPSDQRNLVSLKVFTYPSVRGYHVFTHLLSPLMVSYQLLWPRLTFYERKQVTDLAFREAQHGQILRRQTRRGHCEKNVKELRIMIAGLLETSIEE